VISPPIAHLPTAPPPYHRRPFDAIPFAVDWQFEKKFDAYAGFMFSQVNGGLANGYLTRSIRPLGFASASDP
jgi:hypothetical protein